MYVLIGFNRANPQDLEMICSRDEPLFEWPNDMWNTLNAYTWNSLDMREKQLQMLSFLWELFYDLCLSSEYSVSDSPGFERFLRDFT